MISPTFVILVAESSFTYKKSCLTTVTLNPRVIRSSHLNFYLLLCFESQGIVSSVQVIPRQPSFPPSYMPVAPSSVAPLNHKLSGAELRARKKAWPYIIGISLMTELSCNLAMTINSGSPKECGVTSIKWQILKFSSQIELIYSTSGRICGWQAIKRNSYHT